MVGATSSAGKSTVAAALCRSWARRGRSVAPFKAQNMSNHAAVTADGGEVGRAQAMQAYAARVELDRRMGPVLLKPAADGTSHLVVMGEEVGRAEARGYREQARDLRGTVLDALTGLRTDHPWLVAEGAGGAAEINLLDRDLVNLPLAAAAGIPAVLVVDVDRGGAYASAYGSLALLPDHLRRTVRGVVFNRIRGDASLFADGFAAFEEAAGVPVLGVLPHLGDRPMLGAEDSLDLEAAGALGAAGSIDGAEGVEGADPVVVAVLRLPRLANPSDLDPLVCEPGVEVRWATRPADLVGADLVVVPGSRATVADLDWVRARRLDTALVELAADEAGPVVLGVCAGHQMLGRTIHDDLESGRGTVPGLGITPVTTTFRAPKIVRRAGAGGCGYEIRWGRPDPASYVSPDGAVRGTSVHGFLDDDAVRHDLLAAVAARRGRPWHGSGVCFAAVREEHLDALADWLEAHVDAAVLDRIAAEAVAPGAAPGWDAT